ncbi:hypothetical protein Tco_0781425 [Tanacetum coccineum]
MVEGGGEVTANHKDDNEIDFDDLDDDLENVVEEPSNAATTGVSTASAPVTTVGVAISTAEPKTPPTTTTIFDDEDVILAMAQTLINMNEQKAKEKGVAITDVEDSSRTVRPVRSITTLQPLPTIDPKDKGKGILVEEEPMKIKRSDQVEMVDEVQARIDTDYELAARMTQEEQEKYTIKERARLLAEFFKRRKKQLAAERAKAIRSKPPTKTQLRNLMMTYVKNMCDYKHSQLKGKTYEEIHKLYERQQKRIQDFIPINSEKEVIKDSEKKDDSSSKPARGSRKKTLARKRTGEKQSKESAKRQKLEDTTEEQKSAENEEKTVDQEILSAKYLIVYWESQNLGNVDMEDLHVYKIIKADGNTSYHKSLSSMLMKRFEDNTPEGYNLLLWGDLKAISLIADGWYFDLLQHVGREKVVALEVVGIRVGVASFCRGLRKGGGGGTVVAYVISEIAVTGTVNSEDV